APPRPLRQEVVTGMPDAVREGGILADAGRGVENIARHAQLAGVVVLPVPPKAAAEVTQRVRGLEIGGVSGVTLPCLHVDPRGLVLTGLPPVPQAGDVALLVARGEARVGGARIVRAARDDVD